MRISLQQYGESYMSVNNFLSATTELISMHIDTRIRRSAPMAPEIQARLEHIMQAHRMLEKPEQSGRTIGIKPR